MKYAVGKDGWQINSVDKLPTTIESNAKRTNYVMEDIRKTQGRKYERKEREEKDEYVTDFSKQNWKNRLKFIQAK